jgi:hypothetical protein
VLTQLIQQQQQQQQQQVLLLLVEAVVLGVLAAGQSNRSQLAHLWDGTGLL